LITDIRMPGISGLELQAKLNAEHCRIATIFITAHGDAQMQMQALRAGAVQLQTSEVGITRRLEAKASSPF
jgi:two-component system, LuxR family, response regulator FixJ